MSIFSRVWPFNRGGDSLKIGYQSTGPKRAANLDNQDQALTISAYWASIRLLSEVVASMPIRCYNIDIKKHTKTVNTENHLWNIINYRPNRYQTRTEFIESLVFSLSSWGNAYFRIQRNGAKKIISLMPLAASQVKVQLLRDGEVTYHYTDASNNTIVYAAESIWHIKLFGNGIVGLSPLQYAARALGIAYEMDKRMGTLAANGGKTNGILTVDQALKPEQRESIRQAYKGLENGDSDELFILEAGFDYKQTSLSPSDMQLIENRRFQIEDIARFMGVPSVLINDTSATTTWGSGIEQITQGFYKLNLRPYLERIESSIQRWLMPEVEGKTTIIEFDFDALLRADKITRMDASNKAINSGVLTPNEARADEGLKPMLGGDRIYLNGTLQPAELAERGLDSGTQAPKPSEM